MFTQSALNEVATPLGIDPVEWFVVCKDGYVFDIISYIKISFKSPYGDIKRCVDILALLFDR
jgi:hypothetical protein